MGKKRSSIIWKLPDESFIALVKSSKSMSELLSHFGMLNKGNNYQTCRARILELQLDTSHFLSRIASSNLARKATKEGTIALLKTDSNYSRTHLKKLLIRFDLIKYECSKCQNTGSWQNEKLVLQLEHKNGVCNDHRLENLSFLCPNCHSQTKTFAGRSLKKHKIRPSDLNPNWRHNPQYKLRKVVRPSKEILEVEIHNNTMVALGKKYGVSDNAVRRWCKSYNIELK